MIVCVSGIVVAQIESYIQIARDIGGTIACGGTRPTLPSPFDAGAYINPTVITVCVRTPVTTHCCLMTSSSLLYYCVVTECVTILTAIM